MMGCQRLQFFALPGPLCRLKLNATASLVNCNYDTIPRQQYYKNSGAVVRSIMGFGAESSGAPIYFIGILDGWLTESQCQ